MKVKSESDVTQSCPTLSDPMDCSLPGCSVHGIFQARVLEWVAIAFSTQKYYSSIKQNKIMPLATACIEQVIIILSEGDQRETNIMTCH